MTGTVPRDVGVQSVPIAVQQLGSPPLWFDGTNFTKNQTNPYFLNATGTTTWSYGGSANLASAIACRGRPSAVCVCRLGDRAVGRDAESSFALGTSSFTLTYDRHLRRRLRSPFPSSNNLAFRRSDIGCIRYVVLREFGGSSVPGRRA